MVIEKRLGGVVERVLEEEHFEVAQIYEARGFFRQ